MDKTFKRNPNEFTILSDKETSKILTRLENEHESLPFEICNTCNNCKNGIYRIAIRDQEYNTNYYIVCTKFIEGQCNMCYSIN